MRFSYRGLAGTHSSLTDDLQEQNALHFASNVENWSERHAIFKTHFGENSSSSLSRKACPLHIQKAKQIRLGIMKLFVIFFD